MRNLIYGLILLCSTATATAAEYPLVLDPYATATPPGATVSAGYFSLTNQGDESISITDAYSPDVPKVEIHLSSVVNDVAKMEKQSQVEIPQGTTLKFEHGSYHIMFMDLQEPLVENSTIDLVLVTSVGEMLIEMPVKKLSSKMHDHASEDMAKSSAKTEKQGFENHGEMAMDKNDQSNMSDTEMKEPVKVVH